MSKRLELIASCIKNGIGFIDVGTDHGYLPTMMAQRGYSGSIYASDINPMPLDVSMRTAAEAGVSDKIIFLLGDGLENCPMDKIDTIVIAGMGGDTIVGILDRAEWCMDKRYSFVLQPMTKSEVLRYWLWNNGFGIDRECLVKENGNIYQLMCASFDGTNREYRDSELYTGRRCMTNGESEYIEFIERQRRRFRQMVSGIRLSGDTQLLPRLRIYEQILKELENDS